MADIDLIPKQYLLGRLLRRRLKRLFAALLALACVIAAARGALWLAASHEQQEIGRLRKNEVSAAQIKARMTEYQQQKAASEQQLKVLVEARGRGRSDLLLGALDAAYIPGVWFDEIRSYRAAPLTVLPAASVVAPTGSSASAQVPAAANPGQLQQRVELVGHAVDHSRLATLMTHLSAQPAVAEVQLLDTATRTYSTTTIIDFKVSLAVSGKELPAARAAAPEKHPPAVTLAGPARER